ncbi:baculoviral IAP repeat-containing protein 5b isoform X2 [Brienomyrus brachyistius]|uniref:baculoviral IAP repeat-containing protein 5b isoform X2 n=1 Tax=Brienomyrus brachyistius TaxID=42636 RepID=UPI0020B3EAE2|nr:baculoviral IAP repeat-containing protein 5b isoform X2 [Brienomyrus brachyistius]
MMAKTYSLRAKLHAYSEMYSYEKRLQTFADWPFREDCLCTPEQMAKAGFVHCPSENEPDVVSCFFCLKELEGWEPQDDPWSEHVRRAPDCAFLGLNKDFGDLTVAEFFKLEQERLCILIRKTLQQKMASFRDEVDLVRKNLEMLFDLKDQKQYQTGNER